MKPLGLYLHVPFCTRRCDYCDFYVVVGRDGLREAYVSRLASAIRRAGGGSPGARSADTVYLGGGTPSLLDGVQVGRLLDACRSSFDVDEEAEITLEANPEGVDLERLEGWLEAGVNRLSLGIQSIRDEILKHRGRLHTGAGALGALSLAHRAGFKNISVDFIAGLPGAGLSGSNGAAGGTVREVSGGIEAALEREPDHLSLYLLETDKQTPLMEAARRGRVALPPDDEVAEAFDAARALLARAGFEHYEISSFGRPGRRSRHNLKYWLGDPVLGLGPSAHSSLGGRLVSTAPDLDAFLAGEERTRDHTLADRRAAAREALVLNLRLMQGVDLAEFDSRWGTAMRRELPGRIADLAEAGYARMDGDVLGLTPAGVLLANELFARVSDLEAPPASS